MNSRSLTILLYHGVTNIKSKGIENYSGKHILLREFESQMAFLQQHCRTLSMDEVVWHYEHKSAFVANSVAVTFDDGFKNNFTTAVPVLSAFGIPAAFYVSAGFIGTDKMFWVDALEDCFNRCKRSSITVPMGPTSRKFSLRNRRSRILALETIKNYCKRVCDSEKDNTVDSVREATAVRPSVKSSGNYRKMDWQDLLQIKNNRLFTVGGHSLNHSILSALSPDAIKEEVSGSLALLERELKQKSKHYSYPEGQKDHFNKEVIDCLKNSGIICCSTAIDGVNTLKDDLFHLKRIMCGFNGRAFPFKDTGGDRL